jgi:hypothetical protein
MGGKGSRLGSAVAGAGGRWREGSGVPVLVLVPQCQAVVVLGLGGEN